MTFEIHHPKPDRSHIDLSNHTLLRHWIKTFGKSKKEIEAAIAKVGNNRESVEKELNANPPGSGPSTTGLGITR